MLLVNNDVMAQSVSVELSLLNASCVSAAGGCVARDIWQHKDLGNIAGGSFIATGLGPHASAFIIVNGSLMT